MNKKEAVVEILSVGVIKLFFSFVTDAPSKKLVCFCLKFFEVGLTFVCRPSKKLVCITLKTFLGWFDVCE